MQGGQQVPVRETQGAEILMGAVRGPGGRCSFILSVQVNTAVTRQSEASGLRGENRRELRGRTRSL